MSALPSAESDSVTRVRTRATLARADVARLIMRAAAACRFPTGPDTVLTELHKTIGEPALGVFVGFRASGAQPGGRAVALAIGLLPQSCWQFSPFIVAAYGERGSRQQQVAIGQKLREWIVTSGYSEALAINFLHSDRSALRACRHFGAGSTYGSVLRFGFCEDG